MKHRSKASSLSLFQVLVVMVLVAFSFGSASAMAGVISWSVVACLACVQSLRQERLENLALFGMSSFWVVHYTVVAAVGLGHDWIWYLGLVYLIVFMVAFVHRRLRQNHQ